ncbi:hypothetical protein ACQEXP_07115, partial [Vibrio sp. TRT 1302]
NDHFTQIKNSHNLTVEGESRTLVKQNTTSIVEGSFHQKVGDRVAFELGNEIHIKVGNKVVIDAGSETTLKAGGSFVKLDASGVSLAGPKINLNSGGSPSSGSGYGGEISKLPNGLETQTPPKPITLPAQASVNANTSLLKPCEQGKIK